MAQTLARRTIYLPDSIETLVREHARKDESFSATLVRLIEQGALTGGDKEDWPDYIGSGEGPGDLSINLEKYLGIKPWGPGEGPRDQNSG
ncbi:MAG TPA: hypothetical protein VNP96_05550 [Solirubrobacterales bacterium]|nr:hypothetical protein [Solirubrobacterales bacterium]